MSLSFAQDREHQFHTPSTYVPTGMGAMPDGWDLQPLSRLLDFQNGFNAEKSAYGHGVPFANVVEVITNTHLRDDKIVGRVRVTSDQLKSFMVHPGDVLFNRTSETQDELGLASVYIGKSPIVFGGFVIRGRHRSTLFDPAYAAYSLRAPAVRSQIISRGQGAVRANIGQSELGAVLIPLPPINEQRAIAASLSDADALIDEMRSLIAKKREINQGAKQDLLSGRRRLPGFEGKWETRTLGSMTSFITKGATPTTYGFSWQSDGVLFLRSECVSEHGLDLSQSMFISNDAHKVLKRGEVCSGDILITITGNVGRIIRLPDNFGVANINQHIARIRVNALDVDKSYIFHQLSKVEYIKYYNSIVTGQAYPQISLHQVRNTLVPVPRLDEQVAIADFLSDIDANIIALEIKLAKARQIKEGMMQALLTGKVRLI